MRLRAAALAALVVVAGCSAPRPPSVAGSAPPAATRAVETALSPVDDLTRLPGWAAADLAPALAAFRASCPALQRRADVSGLTEPGDWREACEAARAAPDARRFFATFLAPLTVAGGRGQVTGYFEPELAGSRVRSAAYPVPFYRRPPELVVAALGDFDPALAGRTLRGRLSDGKLIPYFERAAIEDGALAGRGLELAYAADVHAAFFLEVQGSGRLRLPDGRVMRIGYAEQNGRGYTAIGKLLRERGLLAPGQATMAGIIGWMRSQPDGGKALMRENKSKIFFREITGGKPGDGPIGSLGLPLAARASVAADPRFVPLGAPLWLATRAPDGSFASLVVAQDTGGAIKGANRLDMFFGAGDAAGTVAGAMSAPGEVTLLLPPAAVQRIRDRAAQARP